MDRKSQLEATIKAARDELNAIRENDDQGEAEKLVGNCYVFRNCYSCPDSDADYWNLYSRIIAAQAGSVRVVSFQVDKYGTLSIERQTRPHQHYKSSENRLISLSEFLKAWFALLNGPVESFGADVQKKIRVR